MWDWTGLEILPAGVIIGHQFDPRDDIHIIDSDHFVSMGLTDAELSNWDAATHGYFTNLTPETDVLMVTDGNLPTFIEYNYGRGRVIASMQTIEWQYAGMHKGVMFTEFLSNEINYAIAFAISSENDLSVRKATQVNGITVQQVNPGQIFNYNITVTNKDLFNDAPLVVVTDKLPSDVEYLGAEVYPAAPQDYTINQSGDLVYVRYDQIPAASTRYINLTVRAPTNAPTTLYNIVNLRYRNDQNQSDNRMTLATYVPQLGYNQTLAAFSFEDLLHNQSQLLFQFENLLHTVPSNSSANYSFLVSFEQLLRSQAALTSSFEDLLSNESSTGWDGEYSEENRTALLWSYEQMLYDEAFLFASFNAKLNESWTSLCGYTKTGHTQDAQTELIASFEDLLKRQTRLYKSFNLLLKKIDITSQQDMVDFLAAYENLLRVEANLLMSFNELLEAKCSYLTVCSQGCDYSSIQAAVDSAGPGDIIYVAEGTYKENVNIDKSLSIVGAGAALTIIDGNSAGTVFDIGRNNLNVDVTLSGMTILDGSGTLTDYYGDGNPQLCGGGISNAGSTKIIDCNIGTSASPNSAKYGGGISNFGTLIVANSNITGNQGSSQGAGGAIFNEGDGAQMTVTDSIISDNSAYWGAGIWSSDGAAATVTRCKILDNDAIYDGGGICNAGSSTMSPDSILNVIDCEINGNYAGVFGGGITNSGANATVTGSTITANKAGSHGGGIYNRNYNIPGKITLTNNRIFGNSASVGGGIYNSGTLLPDPFDWTQVYNNNPPP